MNADRYWFLTWTTYGTWLPGDERGFVSTVEEGSGPRIRHNQPGTAYDAQMPELRRAALAQLKQDPVWLNVDQARALALQFQETAQYRGWELAAYAIMANHVHLVVGVMEDPDPETILGSFKSYASRCLNRLRGSKQERWWTESGSRRRVRIPGLKDVLRYVRNQANPLVVWTHPEWADDNPGERGASAP